MRGRGYCLDAPLELLDPARILAELDHDTQRRIPRLEIHDDIDSTNRHLMREGHAGAAAGTLCLAERQSAGRGRHGRTWVSPFGANLYLSLLWRYPFGPGELGGLSLAAGTAVARLRHGLVVDEVLEEIRTLEPELLVIGAHRVPETRRAIAPLLDDVAHQILTNAPCSVWIARQAP